jgi:hypothetical protein
MRSQDSGVASSSQLSGARQVGSGKEKATNFPSTSWTHSAKAASLVNDGSATTSPSTGPSVPGLQASIIPFRVRFLGATRSMWVNPRSHPTHVPYCSFRPSTPH